MTLNEWGVIGATIGVVVGGVLEGWQEFKTKGLTLPKIGFGILVVSLAIEIVFDARVAKEAADTRLAAAQIEPAIAPILLNDKDIQEVADKLRPFGKTHPRVEIQTMSQTGDDFMLALDVRAALTKAGFTVSIPQ